MESLRFDLCFGRLKVGVVLQTDSDFPNLWGTFVIDPALSEPSTAEAARMLEFIALNRESIRLLDTEDGGDLSPECLAVAAELEERFGDLIDSDGWHLLDERGNALPILCPILRPDGEVVWRWN